MVQTLSRFSTNIEASIILNGEKTVKNEMCDFY